MATCTGDREIWSVSMRLLDNLEAFSTSVSEQAPDEREKHKIGRNVRRSDLLYGNRIRIWYVIFSWSDALPKMIGRQNGQK